MESMELHKNTEFFDLKNCVKSLKNILSRDEFSLCKRWLNKLRYYPDLETKKAYIQRMHSEIQNGYLCPPFSTDPPIGNLENLPSPHLHNSVRCFSTEFDSDSVSSIEKSVDINTDLETISENSLESKKIFARRSRSEPRLVVSKNRSNFTLSKKSVQINETCKIGDENQNNSCEEIHNACEYERSVLNQIPEENLYNYQFLQDDNNCKEENESALINNYMQNDNQIQEEIQKLVHKENPVRTRKTPKKGKDNNFKCIHKEKISPDTTLKSRGNEFTSEKTNEENNKVTGSTKILPGKGGRVPTSNLNTLTKDQSDIEENMSKAQFDSNFNTSTKEISSSKKERVSREQTKSNFITLRETSHLMTTEDKVNISHSEDKDIGTRKEPLELYEEQEVNQNEYNYRKEEIEKSFLKKETKKDNAPVNHMIKTEDKKKSDGKEFSLDEVFRNHKFKENLKNDNISQNAKKKTQGETSSMNSQHASDQLEISEKIDMDDKLKARTFENYEDLEFKVKILTIENNNLITLNGKYENEIQNLCENIMILNLKINQMENQHTYHCYVNKDEVGKESCGEKYDEYAELILDKNTKWYSEKIKDISMKLSELLEKSNLQNEKLDSFYTKFNLIRNDYELERKEIMLKFKSIDSLHQNILTELIKRQISEANEFQALVGHYREQFNKKNAEIVRLRAELCDECLQKKRKWEEDDVPPVEVAHGENRGTPLADNLKDNQGANCKLDKITSELVYYYEMKIKKIMNEKYLENKMFNALVRAQKEEIEAYMTSQKHEELRRLVEDLEDKYGTIVDNAIRQANAQQEEDRKKIVELEIKLSQLSTKK